MGISNSPATTVAIITIDLETLIDIIATTVVIKGEVINGMTTIHRFLAADMLRHRIITPAATLITATG